MRLREGMSGNKNKPSGKNARQLALDLPVSNYLTREDLVEGAANSLAIEMIDRWPKWPGNVVILAGPVGCGKSHLGAVWAKKADARCLAMNLLGELGEDRGNERPLLLEDACAGGIDETKLFHILNAKRSTNSSIIITSRSWPTEWGITLADLDSRLRAAQLIELGEPDDELLAQILYKLFADRQLPVEPKLIDYLVIRMERSLATAHRIVARIDEAALARKQKITRQLAGEILQEMERGEIDE